MKKQCTVHSIGLAAIVVAASILHSHGYKIYGYPHMYRSAPPANEGWIKVETMDSDHFILEGGASINLHPFYLTERALALSPEELSKNLFGLSPNDIYVRKEANEWILRVGNRYLCAHRSFFPKREYGYYENELLDSIAGSEINVPLGEGLIGGESEEAVENYYKTRAYQGASRNESKRPPES